MGHFSRSFSKLRALSGFKNAYSYYHLNGGRRVFPFTYVHYLKIERGGSLPTPRAFAVMLDNLRRGNAPAERRRLVDDYLRDLCADDEVYDRLFAPLSIPTIESAQTVAVRNLRAHFSSQVTIPQLQAIAASRESTGVFTLLAGIPNSLTLKDISGILGADGKKCLAALRTLRGWRLVRSAGKDRWQNRGGGLHYQLPKSKAASGLLEKLNEHRRALAKERGQDYFGNALTLRLDPAGAQSAVAEFERVYASILASNQELSPAGPETPVYLIETRMHRMLTFDDPATPPRPSR
ncbi:MAG: hypothetical protein HKL90_04030 [Elusimicrobia bacterium]|nr:hypothetical protein [Elusimicrobiota bacterium]